jgi:TolB-like protein/DNA-binding winged helix-turn-helix (wHTH) protein/tetratricopeptide (TPR) repeat protein
MNRPTPWRSIMASVVDRRPFQVGGAMVDPVSREASWSGGKERLQPQTLKVLMALISHRGELVTRDDLVQLCWNGRIVGDDVINRSISLLRHFADRAGGFEIETVPRAGYRLVDLGSARASRRHWLIVGSVGVLAIAGLAVFTVRLARDNQPRTLAVMPFEASTGGDGQLAEGLSGELTSQLAQNGGLRVIGRASVWQYKDKAVDPRVIGQQLGVDYLVDGDVAGSGDGIRVTASLVRTRDGATIWSQVYSASRDQTPQISAAVGGGVSQVLGVPSRPEAAGYRPNGDAYALYLKGRALFRERSNTSMEAARALMLQAIAIDPKFAGPWAYAGGITYLLNQKSFRLSATSGSSPPITPVRSLKHALELDPNLADAHGFLGWIDQPYTVEAAGHLQRAVQLSPNDPQILYWWSQGLLRQGNYAEYAQVAHRDAALDPLWPKSVGEAASASLWAGDNAAVKRYVHGISVGNPAGAVEVESILAGEQCDLSRMVQLGLANKLRPFQQSTYNAGLALMNMGFIREGRLVSQIGPKDLLYNLDRAPDRATLLKMQAQDPDGFDYLDALFQLRVSGRYADIVALYDVDLGDLREIRRATFANRALRMNLGAVVAQALDKLGRRQEAAQLFRLTDDADQTILGFGKVSPAALVTIASNDAIEGRREEAMELLSEGFAKGYYVSFTRKDQVDPIWEILRSDPRFKRIADASLAKLREERRETLALGLF